MIKTVNGINIGLPSGEDMQGFYMQDGTKPEWNYISCHNTKTLEMFRQFLEGVNEDNS